MIKPNKFILGVVAIVLSACNTTTKNTNQLTQPAVVLKESNWQVSEPLNTLYDYHLIDVRNDKPRLVDLNNESGGLSEFDVIFIGENHRHPGNHLAQARIYERLIRDEKNVILSMEQFERDTQQFVDAYLNNEIGEWSLRHFGRAWGNYQSSYRPLVEMAKEHNLPVIAANAPKDTVVCTGRHGIGVLDKLPEERKAQIAASFHTPENGAYFEKFTGSISHGAKASVSKKMIDRYHAQVIRDDTMAESIHLAMEANPNHKLVHLNGHFHSASGLGTVERLKLRRTSKIAVIQPVFVGKDAKPSFTEADRKKGDYLLLIRSLAEQVITKENRNVWMKKVFKRSEQDCSFGTSNDN